MFIQKDDNYINVNHIVKFQKIISSGNPPTVRIWHSANLMNMAGVPVPYSDVRFATEEEVDRFIEKILAVAQSKG